MTASGTRRPRSKAAVGHRTRVGQERRARTRARIIDAALRVVAERGPDAPVIDDFIRAAGVSRGTFYNYFTRVEELQLAASSALEDELIRWIEAAMVGLTDPVARLATGVRLWLHWCRSDPIGCAFIVRSRFRGPLVESQLTSDLRGGLRAGRFSFRSVAIARDLVVGTTLEAMHRIMTSRVSKGYVDDVTRAVLRGLGLDEHHADQLLKRGVPELSPGIRFVG